MDCLTRPRFGEHEDRSVDASQERGPMRRPIKGKLVNVNERPVGPPSTSKAPNDAHHKLMDVVPRSLYRGEIYEIFVTDDPEAKPGGKVNRFSLVGHFEVDQGGFVRAGDHVLAAGKEVGTIVGYNQCPALRAPESVVIHIYVRGKKLVNGKDLGLKLEDEVTTRPVDPKRDRADSVISGTASRE
jgi:hypothetical protein